MLSAWIFACGSGQAPLLPTTIRPPARRLKRQRLPRWRAEQKQIAERFDKLKEKLLRMAELTAATDPRRAALLRKAVAQANDRGIDAEFGQLVELLAARQPVAGVKTQDERSQDLARLLELLLSEDRSKRIQSEKAADPRIHQARQQDHQGAKRAAGRNGRRRRRQASRRRARRTGRQDGRTGPRHPEKRSAASRPPMATRANAKRRRKRRRQGRSEGRR